MCAYIYIANDLCVWSVRMMCAYMMRTNDAAYWCVRHVCIRYKWRSLNCFSETNHRSSCAKIMEQVQKERPWFGLEQEYTLFDVDGIPLGWPKHGTLPPQGQLSFISAGVYITCVGAIIIIIIILCYMLVRSGSASVIHKFYVYYRSLLLRCGSK